MGPPHSEKFDQTTAEFQLEIQEREKEQPFGVGVKSCVATLSKGVLGSCSLNTFLYFIMD